VAAEHAKRVGISVVSICGNSGGKLKEYSDVMIIIPHSGTADRIQELSIIIIHILVNLIEKGVSANLIGDEEEKGKDK
jgi:D-sedoheptulose 7-phosphate isomerase